MTNFNDQDALYENFYEIERKATFVGTTTKPKTGTTLVTYNIIVCQSVLLIKNYNLRLGHFPAFSEKHFYDLINCFDPKETEFGIISGTPKEHVKWSEALHDLGYKSKFEYSGNSEYQKDLLVSPSIGIMVLRHRQKGKEIVRLY